MNPKYRDVTVRSSRLLVGRFEQVVADNYSDRDFDLQQMARAMSMSERQLQRKIRQHTGRTPSSFLRSFRLSKSLECLLSGATVQKTAKAVGFSSQAYFASCFKAEFGRTPTQYRERRSPDAD